MLRITNNQPNSQIKFDYVLYREIKHHHLDLDHASSLVENLIQ